MQERSYTLPMCSVNRTSHVPSASANLPVDTHSSSTVDVETGAESSTNTGSSTPELNLLLDKLTEILRFRSGCRRHLGVVQNSLTTTNGSSSSTSPTTTTTTMLKRLQSCSMEPLHNNNAGVSSMTSHASSISTGAWKSSSAHHKAAHAHRLDSHHHHHHLGASTSANGTSASGGGGGGPNGIEKKRRFPSLLQRLIDEGNLIKEAVRRLKTQRFSSSFKQQQQHPNTALTPSTPTKRPSPLTIPVVTLSSRLTPSSTATSSISIPQQLSDPPTNTTSSPSRSISWFLSSSVFGVTTGNSSGSGSPLRTCYSSGTHDRTPMEIGIHDGC